MKKILILTFAVAMAIASSGEVNAQKPSRNPSSTGPTNPTPTNTIGAPSQSGETRAAVGSCNSGKGCRALKKACLKLKGGTFKPADSQGNSGICDAPSQSLGSGSQGVLVANPNVTQDAHCFSFALCKELRKTCQGTYSQTGSNGTCKD
jgi:hypothetical protein